MGEREGRAKRDGATSLKWISGICLTVPDLSEFDTDIPLRLVEC